MKFSPRVLFAGAIACLTLATPMNPTASAQATVNAGILTCHVAGGLRYIIGASRAMQCNFRPNSGVNEEYHGSMSTIGADIGYLASASIVLGVRAPSSST